MTKIKHQLILSIIVGLAAWACDQNRVFEEYREIEKKMWHKDSIMVFNVQMTDTITNHNLYVNIRNDIQYGYSNLWLFIELQQPGGISTKDTFEITLAHPSGEWLGKGFGGIKTNQVIYKRNVFFPVSGNYKIALQQGMREENLSQITEVGIRIEKVK